MNQDIIVKLRIAEAVNGAELYSISRDNGGPRFGFRIWDGLSLLTNSQAEQFVAEFNEATADMRRTWAEKLAKAAAYQLAQELGE